MFFSLRLREEAGASNSLPILCHACHQVVSTDPNSEGVFETGLITAGYLATHEDEYSKTHWRVVEELLFDVGARFPRITAEKFAAGVPPGVEELAYTINLGTFDDLIVARKPMEASTLIKANDPGY